MNKRIFNNRKGFTLVELLAVVVILGILMTISIPAVSRWIDKGKSTNLDSQKETLIMASKSFAQSNRSKLPKAVGDHTEITAKELRQNNYLDKDIVDGNKDSCMAESKVVIYKISSNNYSYIGYLYCGKKGSESGGEIAIPSPVINVTFDGTVQQGYNQNISNGHVTINIKGGTGTDGSLLGIASYRYTIAYNNGSTDKIELFNTEYIEAGGREEITIEKELRDYVDVNKVTNIYVSVSAFNTAGGKAEKTANSQYSDKIGPKCGKITGQAGENEWLTAPNSIRKISVECIDTDGSGCVKDVYTKTFKSQVNKSKITIYDNNGNSTDCPVTVHLDWTTPTLTVNVYKRNASGGKEGNAIATATANNTNKVVNINSFTNGISADGDSWLNAANYPYGVYIEVKTSDNILLNQGVYKLNAKALKKNASNVNTLTVQDTNNAINTHYELVDEGYRKATYTLTDAAKNSVTVNLTVPIDRTKPSCGAMTGMPAENSWNKAWRDITITDACTDAISQCTSGSMSKKFTTQSEMGTIDIADKAANTRSCSVRVHLDWTAPTVNFSSTNNFATSQTATVSVSDAIGASGYYFGTTAPNANGTNVTYTALSGNPKTWSKSETITAAGTYYFSLKDRANNITTLSKVYYRTNLVPNRGSVSPNYVITLSGNSINLPNPAGAANQGYGFEGWFKETAFNNRATSPYKPVSNITLYGKWVACGKGKYSNNITCVNCGAGYYSTGNANATCTRCPNGYTSNAGAQAQSSCYVNCGNNQRVERAGATCTGCPSGWTKGAHTVYYGNTSGCNAPPPPPPPPSDDCGGHGCWCGCCNSCAAEVCHNGGGTWDGGCH